jgi:beta-lactamase class A
VQGKTKTLNDCVTAMLKVSNNACGKAVGDYVGWEYADAELKVIGLEKTRLNSDLGPMTTAADVAYYLQGLYEGKWFDGASRDFIIKTLDQQILRAGIPHGCGSGCAVADKTGDLGFVRHDAAIVRYAGGAYVLSVFSDGASYADISGLAAQIQAYIDAG